MGQSEDLGRTCINDSRLWVEVRAGERGRGLGGASLSRKRPLQQTTTRPTPFLYYGSFICLYRWGPQPGGRRAPIAEMSQETAVEKCSTGTGAEQGEKQAIVCLLCIASNSSHGIASVCELFAQDYGPKISLGVWGSFCLEFASLVADRIEGSRCYNFNYHAIQAIDLQ